MPRRLWKQRPAWRPPLWRRWLDALELERWELVTIAALLAFALLLAVGLSSREPSGAAPVQSSGTDQADREAASKPHLGTARPVPSLRPRATPAPGPDGAQNPDRGGDDEGGADSTRSGGGSSAPSAPSFTPSPAPAPAPAPAPERPSGGGAPAGGQRFDDSG